MKLNLGCGNKSLVGYHNVDVIQRANVDQIVNLEQFPYPFESSSASVILLDNVLEHLEDPLKVISECGRILKKGGILKIIVPHYSNCLAYADITHKRFYSYFTFEWIVKNRWEFRDFPRFKMIQLKYEFYKGKLVWDYVIQPIANAFPSFYEYSPLRVFQAKEIICEMRKL